jgi:hypothetical protein
VNAMTSAAAVNKIEPESLENMDSSLMYVFAF